MQSATKEMDQQKIMKQRGVEKHPAAWNECDSNVVRSQTYFSKKNNRLENKQAKSQWQRQRRTEILQPENQKLRSQVETANMREYAVS